MAATGARLRAHQAALSQCARCPGMTGPVVMGRPAVSKILQIGQAPGPYEGRIGQPFAWTAGKTLFKWYASLGVDEEAFRSRVYMAAVCRCFPGKNPSGGDRVPDREEIARCGEWLREEVAILQPALIIPVGKLAIAQMLHAPRLDELIGRVHRVSYFGHAADAIPLPHPSGLSTWFKVEPGKTLLREALHLIGRHPAWRATFHGEDADRP
ncbi:MAG: uracil-DNA glycosylase family protein [Gallionellaceae bacterium]|nr:uracil-DNA glycosylase family protein [Gallionellaceae bacterium]